LFRVFVGESSESRLITIAAIVKSGTCDCFSTHPQNENKIVSTYCPNTSNCSHLTILLPSISSPLLSHSLSFPPLVSSRFLTAPLLSTSIPPTTTNQSLILPWIPTSPKTSRRHFLREHHNLPSHFPGFLSHSLATGQHSYGLRPGTWLSRVWSTARWNGPLTWSTFYLLMARI
jgi:hypothetical protein